MEHYVANFVAFGGYGLQASAEGTLLTEAAVLIMTVTFCFFRRRVYIFIYLLTYV